MKCNKFLFLIISLILILLGLTLCNFYIFNMQKDSLVLESTCSSDSLIFNNDILNKYCLENDAEACKLQNRIFNFNVLRRVCNNGN